MMISLLSSLAAAQVLSTAEQEAITWVGLPWWAWFLIFLAVVLFVWWRLSASAAAMEKEAELIGDHEGEEHPEVLEEAHGIAEQLRMEALVETEADDLTVIEGIGPKISATLNQAGIMTYAQLADAEADRLDQIINQAGLRMVSVETWSEQSELARQGRWDDLRQMQDKLKGGRKSE